MVDGIFAVDAETEGAVLAVAPEAALAETLGFADALGAALDAAGLCAVVPVPLLFVQANKENIIANTRNMETRVFIFFILNTP